MDLSWNLILPATSTSPDLAARLVRALTTVAGLDTRVSATTEAATAAAADCLLALGTTSHFSVAVHLDGTTSRVEVTNRDFHPHRSPAFSPPQLHQLEDRLQQLGVIHGIHHTPHGTTQIHFGIPTSPTPTDNDPGTPQERWRS